MLSVEGHQDFTSSQSRREKAIHVEVLSLHAIPQPTNRAPTPELWTQTAMLLGRGARGRFHQVVAGVSPLNGCARVPGSLQAEEGVAHTAVEIMGDPLHVGSQELNYCVGWPDPLFCMTYSKEMVQLRLKAQLAPPPVVVVFL